MQYRYSLIGAIGLASNAAMAAYVPSEPWSTLTPDKLLQGGATDYASTFGIQIVPATVNKRDVATQIGDGQVQANTATASAPVVTQIGDGQVQADTATATAPVVTQIGDGQVQANSDPAPVVTQIGDGQVQAATATAPVVTQIGDGQVQANTDPVVSQIGDGQVQAATASVVTQIGDGQVQAATATDPVVSQINDGQIQATTATNAASQISDGQVQATTATGASQISDGQVQATPAASGSSGSTRPVSCKADGALSMTLKGGILTDGSGRIGSIVANRQFQFDGPPPQAGAIYAAGWSVSDDGKLAIGETTKFYQCLSGDFYNLYDEDIGSVCEPVYLDVVNLVSC
ncbi:unnamed protein product [Ambrosiozyma monospora]|uniref:Unnamed protein product n=1 Tax=Ambrosiozyma monospora TaxID=43982 RepID=A0ACB5SR86_AMBMO|nr:unnamed protein product [Ambrosiozyma monospora]